MRVVLLTPVRLLAEGVGACLVGQGEVAELAFVRDLAELRAACAASHFDVAVIDVTHGVDLEEIRALASEFPSMPLLALGLLEQRQEVIRCGRAGFAGYATREATAETLLKAIRDAVAGRLACPAEISGGLLRELFRTAPSPDEGAPLTRREGDILHLIGEGMSNKEIARELDLSVSTVKHHVHNILDKLNLPRRAQAMRHVRSMPWIAGRPRSSTARS